MLAFYYGSGSPYAWRVWLALEHKAVAYEQHVLSFSAGEHRTPAYAAINPRHKVPAIVDDGFALYESGAIVEYLEERFPDGPPLFPGDLRQRALVRRLVRETDAYLDEALRPLLQRVLMTAPAAWDAAAIDAALDAARPELARVEAAAAGPAFLAGALSAADFALYPFLALALRVDVRRPQTRVRDALGAATLAWMARMEALPLVARTMPPHWRP